MTHDVSLPLKLNALCRIIPTKWRSYRDHRFCDVTSPYVDSGSSDVTVIYVHDTLAILRVLVGWRA